MHKAYDSEGLPFFQSDLCWHVLWHFKSSRLTELMHKAYDSEGLPIFQSDLCWHVLWLTELMQKLLPELLQRHLFLVHLVESVHRECMHYTGLSLISTGKIVSTISEGGDCVLRNIRPFVLTSHNHS
ncbi:hypothetical protein PoB_007580300 [Plakobranchus ocellatus]|uniref:Uncharacterized protein n=1 Tax=Plakobranchus ocellatus TaxID=259542 RepID=A0AAV4DYY2_9GAST|nr:hypothetical protein PoB_007580300 [Plakobranchus ocellatus]